ncbi:MAG TPA: tRNA (guanosine(46)-N7)-methyltransferase TrmB [Pseudolabrys sp.]|nr:tRNA (guanosine(46)-N7)-methyltransferase TrmB [Pseudolabrys sp.]
MNAASPPREPRAFFGRRKGHTLRDRQAALFSTLLPTLALPLGQPAPDDLRALFAVPVREVRMEIGFGGAEHLIAQAQQHPDVGYIGVEPFVNGMAKALTAIDTLGLRNIRVHFDDAVALLDWLPPAALARIDLLYPDPWPKRRHWKRRFVQDESLKALARLLREGGEFRFATDIPHYAAWTLARIMRSPDFAWTAECAADWRLPWPGFVRTRYEAKAVREGRTPAYFIFRRGR